MARPRPPALPMLYSHLPMTVSYFWRSRNSRTALIVLLLLISLATASTLALHAYYSDLSQRASAENVLHDYSALVADEVIRRSVVEIGYSGYYPLIGAVVHEIQQSGGLSGTTKTDFLSAQDARVKRAAGLAKSYFQMDPSTGGITFFGDEPQADAPDWLRQSLLQMSAQQGDSGGQVIRSPMGETPRLFIASATQGSQGRKKVAGFEVDLPVLTQWFGAALNRQPLVPPSLGHGQVTNAFVRAIIRDHGGVERFRLGDGQPPRWAVTKPFGDIYQGIFIGFTVEASIDPRVSRQIVIGGLPPSRLPFFLGMLALNAGLIVTAILQLRREMALQKLRDEFVSSVSHELRTPLTQIRMFAETLLLDRIRSDDEHRRSLEIIDREARRLTQLVENVLQFSRAERKIESMAKEERELAPLIHEIVDDCASVVQGEQARFECRLCPGLSASVDSDALRQIVINLLDNALKYGPKQQVVIVGLEHCDGMARVFVDDEGPGIPPADRKRVFKHFQRLERDRQSAIAGTGIGLSVVRDLVIRHGGRYSVVTGDRGGARFVVELPLVAAASAALKEPVEEPR
jgi:signal transduction histidine kinase